MSFTTDFLIAYCVLVAAVLYVTFRLNKQDDDGDDDRHRRKSRRD